MNMSMGEVGRENGDKNFTVCMLILILFFNNCERAKK